MRSTQQTSWLPIILGAVSIGNAAAQQITLLSATGHGGGGSGKDGSGSISIDSSVGAPISGAVSSISSSGVSMMSTSSSFSL